MAKSSALKGFRRTVGGFVGLCGRAGVLCCGAEATSAAVGITLLKKGSGLSVFSGVSIAPSDKV